MFALSLPFTALAAPGDYEPDVSFVFGTYHGADGWTDYDVVRNENTISYSGLYGAPVEYDYTVNKTTGGVSGTLRIDADKANASVDETGYETLSEDYKMSVGDYFTITYKVANLSTLGALQAVVNYSDNIEPAGFYSIGSGARGTYKLGTLSDYTSDVGTRWYEGGESPLSNWEPVYDANPDFGAETTAVNADEKYLWAQWASNTSLSVTDDYFINPETGALGYTYDCYLSYTYVFKITGEGPIEFTPKNDSNDVSTFYIIAKQSDGIARADYTTYAKNVDGLSEEDIANGVENPGSRKMTFFGYNVNNSTGECDHTNTTLQNQKDTTCTADGYTGDLVCTDCGETVTQGEVIPALGHDFSGAAVSDNAGHHQIQCVRYADCGTLGESVDCTYNREVVQEPTVTTAGLARYTCTVCGYSYDENIPAVECTHDGETEVRDAKAATCTEEGYIGDTYCLIYGEKIADGTVIPMIAHTAGEAVREHEVAATCTAKGSYDEVVYCEVCNTELSRDTFETEMIPHTEGEAVIENRVEPTVDSDGGYDTVVRCTVCDTVIRSEHTTIPALKGYNVTVTASDMGTVTIDGVDATAGITKKIAAGSKVTLVATPVEGAKFVGLEANGLTTVSTDATFVATVLANVTYTPVFAIDNAEEFTVTFVDAYGNVVSSQTVTQGSDIVVPELPARPGYSAATDNGWSMTNDDIAKLASSATITAQYQKNASDKFTVTAAGAEISANGQTATDVLADVAYDSLVTVKAVNATAWKVNGVTVAYGDSYSFYLGADVTVEAVFDTVTATPTVANVAVSETGTEGAIRATFLATRSMTDDCTFINAGFVYGKGDLGAVTLDDVDGTNVKAAYVKTDVEQFSLTYGLRAQTGTVTARAFLAYVDAEGNTQVIYTDPLTYTYA